jgi:thioredoxin-related protein
MLQLIEGGIGMHRMMRLFVLMILLATTLASAQTEKSEKADVVLKTTLQQAGGANKNVLLIFHASWCGWCRRLEAVLENTEIKKIMDEHYVVAHLDVMENDAKKSMENPGGNEMMAQYGGAKSGLPFYVFLDAHGKKLTDSNVMPKNQNIGYPGSTEEISAFEKLLKETAPRMTDKQLGQIVAYLQKNAPH